MGSKSGTLRGEGAINTTFTDMTWDGNRANQPSTPGSLEVYGKFGFYCEACNDTVVQRVGMINFPGYGFDPHGVGGVAIYSNRLTITDCYAANNGWDGTFILLVVTFRLHY